METTSLVESAETFKTNLINWYDANARDLPWRTNPSLYKTVVSEFMLQQTQVKTVLPYFSRWIETYPDFQTLALADESSILKSWEGLGYYSRARNLHKLAKEISSLESIPTDAKSWIAFPGIGPYAAAAVCSISFSDPSAVVDGNVVRILARLAADTSEYKNSTEAAKKYSTLARDLLNTDRPGDHNQAMMELGATVCHKQKPQCLLCPVNGLCRAKAQGIEDTLPRLSKIKYEKQSVERAWIIKEGKALIHLIPENSGRMKGLHEIPGLSQLKLKTPKKKPLLTRNRSITRYRITERIHSIEPDQISSIQDPTFHWIPLQNLENLPFSGPHRKWIRELLTLS